jgi:hypothetical protein
MINEHRNITLFVHHNQGLSWIDFVDFDII